ncbi:hypothetical protein Tco_0471266 [Tanacetum coccineum]
MSDEMEWRSTTTVAKQPPTPPLLLAGYRLDGSSLGMVRLLYLCNRKKTFLDPSIDGDLYKLPRGYLLVKKMSLNSQILMSISFAFPGGQITSLCKVRMDCPSLKTAKSEVKRCEKVLDVALIELRPRQLH